MAKNDIINVSKSLNYVAGNKIFILSTIQKEDCCELIGNISNMVDNIDWHPPFNPDNNKYQLTNPYKISTATPVIDIYINSPGGTVNVYQSIMSLLNIARAKGAVIRTTVMGEACSCASVLAIQGTPGFRIMYINSYNLVHYGNTTLRVNKEKELERVCTYEKDLRDKFLKAYLMRTKITEPELQEMISAEHKYIPAIDCLNKYNMCDWVITSDGKFIKRNTKSR